MKKIYINKMLAAVVAVALITSIFVLISPNEKMTAAAWLPTTTPGVDDFGNATTDLVYGQTVTPTINTTGMSATTYFLYKPAYNCSGTGYRYAAQLEWFEQVLRTDTGTAATLTVTTPGNHYSLNGPILLDRAGMWVFDDSDPSSIDGNDTSTFDAFFWVNTSQAYDIASVDSFDYGSNTTKTITVTEDDSAVTNSCYIDLIAPNGSTVFHQYESDGIYSFGTYGNITMAGNYTIRAYSDLDLYSSAAYLYYDEGLIESYDNTYGTMFSASKNATLISAGDHWNYTICGPWDPPEVNATESVFRVTSGTPSLSIPAGNQTMYWNFSGEVNVSIQDTSGDAIAASDYTVEIYNDDDVAVTSYFTYGDANGTANITEYDGYCHINATNWGVNGSTHYGGNGTWYAYIYVDLNSDRTESSREWTEEWNGTVEWKVQTAPGAQFKWVDDDGTVSSDNNDGVLPYIPIVTSVPLNIQFQVIGGDHTYYGATDQDGAKENITLSGNALFTGTLDKIPGVTYSGGTWTVPVVPTMSQNGGSINIVVTWEDYGSISETLNIGGSNYLTNGTIVTITSGNSEFETGTDQTFTVQLDYANGVDITYGAKVYLYYVDDGEVAANGDPLQGHIVSQDLDGSDGYTLGFNTTQQTTNQTVAGGPGFTYIKAPRNLTVYAIGYYGGTEIYGYARIYMKPAHDLKVTFEAVDSPGTSTLLAGYKYSYFYINITTIDAAGNDTGTPDADDYTQMTVKIVDEDGNDVTTSIGSISSSDIAAANMGDDYIYKLSNEYITSPGTFTVYAYNYTHDTEGNNATVYVKQAHVECDKTPFIWSYDNNISATFTVTSEITDERLNGTLRIENMTYTVGTEHWYNKTWTNTSASANGTIDLDEGEGFINGEVTIHDITADYLPPGVALRNITFWFRPELSDGGSGVWARASGLVGVKVPTVRFDAKEGDPDAKEIKYVRSGLFTDLSAYVTGRDELLPDIFVGLSGQGVSQNGTSGSLGTDKGKVTFTIIPTSTGNITVDVGEEGRTVTKPVIVVTSWDLDISVNPRINELTTFTVTVTKKDTGTAVEGAAVEIEGIGTVNTNSEGKAVFEGTYKAPEVTSDTPYTVTATKDGYKPDTATITIVNIPKLTVSLNPTTAKQGASVKVTVSKDDATPAVNALVTLEGDTTEYYTDGNGQVTITAPSSDGTYTVTASFGTFQDGTATLTVSGKTEEPPGFELLTLIIAIGIAYILLRRRRR